ncbi:hypothetical protein K3M35_05175 [Rhodococcus sp. DMU2021]|uniref:hypothetical protein n=1 Tax=Rhodococcus sp. DMU2021 TaxID=2866997 RepID=UPI001C7D42E0|nr:hypothetical protein [Rhodococcus sp. DMU2021]MBX4168058.1 hypothetical protein [Rhodococcus sp. DMU2021]
MPRTPEQIAADDALTAAIENHQAAYHDDNEGVLTDYLVIAGRTFWDDDGDQVEAVYLTVRDDSVSLSKQLGLVEFASLIVRRHITDD